MSYEFREIDHPSFQNFISQVVPLPMKCVTVHRKSDSDGNGDNLGKALCVLGERYIGFAERVKMFEVRQDDVWIVTYPKSGTTWAQEMVWLICNNLDYKTAKEVMVYERSVFFELGTLIEGFHDTMTIVEKMESPRHIKSHLPGSLLPDQIWEKKPKIVYVARNPKDVVISYYHHHRLLDGYKGSFETFAEAFLEDLVQWSPYWDHVLEFWQKRDENILFLTYEDMKKDLPAVIKKVCNFFDKEYNDSQISELAKHLHFDSMKDNEACNLKTAVERVKNIRGIEPPPDLNFMRKGKTGAWKTEMDAVLASRIDDWSRKAIEGTDFNLWGLTGQ